MMLHDRSIPVPIANQHVKCSCGKGKVHVVTYEVDGTDRRFDRAVRPCTSCGVLPASDAIQKGATS